MEIHAFELFWALVNLGLVIAIPILLIFGFVKIYANTKKTLAKVEELERKIDSLNR